MLNHYLGCCYGFGSTCNVPLDAERKKTFKFILYYCIWTLSCCTLPMILCSELGASGSSPFCCVLLWLVNVKMWYRSFSKHSWLEKSGHSGRKVNKISPSVPESWRECEWQRQPAAVRAPRQRWLSNTAKRVEFPFVRNSFHPYRRHFFPVSVTQNRQKEPQTWPTTKSRSVSFRQGAHSRPRIYYVLLSHMNKSVFISSV